MTAYPNTPQRAAEYDAAAWVEWLEGVGKPAKTPDDYLREPASGESPRLPPLFAVARGSKDGRPATAAAALLSAPAVGMGGATGVPLAISLAMVRPDLKQKRGVLAPEAAFAADSFFERLAPLCSPVKQGRADLVLVSRSWKTPDLRPELRRLSA